MGVEVLPMKYDEDGGDKCVEDDNVSECVVWSDEVVFAFKSKCAILLYLSLNGKYLFDADLGESNGDVMIFFMASSNALLAVVDAVYISLTGVSRSSGFCASACAWVLLSCVTVVLDEDVDEDM